MARLPRLAIPDLPYHVTQRGNRRQAVFFQDDDRRLYLSLLQAQAQRYGIGGHMTNCAVETQRPW